MVAFPTTAPYAVRHALELAWGMLWKDYRTPPYEFCPILAWRMARVLYAGYRQGKPDFHWAMRWMSKHQRSPDGS